MKSVLISIQPYWVFLIIAQTMGWNIGQEKTVEVRKSYPKAENWDKTVKIYCSKDKKSFAKIPKEYQPLMCPLLGKVIGEFVCDFFDEFEPSPKSVKFRRFRALGDTRLTLREMIEYLNGQKGYGWHISDLVIYDEPKDLSEFVTVDNEAVKQCEYRERIYNNPDFTNGAMLLGTYLCNDKTNWCIKCKTKPITRPPQSWCYVERSDNNAA